MIIYVVNGKMGAGKTTFENMVKKIFFEKKQLIVEIVSIIDSIKDVATYCGWKGEKENKDRKMLCDMKDILTEWNDYPYQKLKEKILDAQRRNIYLLFVDCREIEDIKRIKKEFGAKTLFVDGSNTIQIADNHADQGVAAQSLDFYDSIIYNKFVGFENLQRVAEEFCVKVVKEHIFGNDE